MLMAEATKQEGRRHITPEREWPYVRVPDGILGLLPPLGREHEVRYMLAGIDRNLAELRSIA
jgi:hypothetical protein